MQRVCVLDWLFFSCFLGTEILWDFDLDGKIPDIKHVFLMLKVIVVFRLLTLKIGRAA